MSEIALGKDVSLVTKGMIVGTGAILPGISGGVLLAAFGIYEPMMQVLSHPREGLKKHGRMFGFFLLGWVLGFVLLARAVEVVFTKSSVSALMLFAGLILGTVPGMLKESESNGWLPMWGSLIVFGALFALFQSNVSLAIVPSPLWYVLCGLVWGLSLVVPGLSSSSLLILLGLYVPMTSGIASLDPMVIIPLLVGIVITVSLTAKSINALFEKHHGIAYQIVAGIMIASTLFMLPTIPMTFISWASGLTCLAIGYLIAIRMS